MKSPEEWGDTYAEVEWKYDRFAERLEELLRNLLQDEELSYISSTWWSESAETLADRIYVVRRGGSTIDDPLSEFGDLAGVTIVAATKDDIEPICALVERELEIDDDASLPFRAAEKSNTDIASGGHPGRIYYDFPRLVVSLPAERAALSEWEAFFDLRAEIRVQTRLQEAWEKIDEWLAFAWDSSYADGAREAIVETATLLAQADERLTLVTVETQDAVRRTRDAISNGDLTNELDAPALWTYLMESPTVTRLIDLGVDAGLMPWERVAGDWELEQQLLWVLRQADLRTLQDLDDLLRASVQRAPEILSSIAELGSEGEFTPSSAPVSLVTWLVLVLTRADADTIALTEFRNSIVRALNTLIGNPAER